MSNGTDPDFLSIVISRKDIESGDISSTISVLAKLLNPDAALKYCEKVDNPAFRPSSEQLGWHNENRYRP